MENIKKISIYNLNVKYFNDSNNDGIGDLKGLLKKIDYFTFLNIDALILNDILSSESNEKNQNFTSISNQVGTIDDFEKIIKKCKKIGIKIFIEMNLGSIKKQHKWFKDSEKNEKKDFVEFKKKETEINGVAKFNENNNKYYLVNEITQEIPINWNSSIVSKNFIKIIKYWINLKIDGFVFKNFENIHSKEKTMSKNTLLELKKIYKAIKEINDNIFTIAKSKLIDYKLVNKYTLGSKKIFDYFICSQISLLGTHKKYGNDLIGKFYPHKLNKIISILGKNPTNILAFGNELSGRINSRWGDPGQYNSEAAKTICLLNLMTKASSSIYYSDELGAKNIGLTFLDDFQDKTLNLRKTNFFDIKIKEKDFMAAQVLQNPINARTLMLWNNKRNSGFSLANKTITPVSEGYIHNNVEVQFKNKNSILNFYKNVNEFLKNKKFSNVIKNGKLIISNYFFNLGIIKYKYELNKKKIIIISNFSLIKKKILITPKIKNIILSSYTNKKYHEFPSWLEAYETLLITNLYEEEMIKEIEKDVYKIKPKINPTILKTKKENIVQKEEHKEIIENVEELEKTKLKEEEIAETTQIDDEDIDNIDKLLK